MSDKTDWSYLAGLVDGEGHIALLKNRHHRQAEGFVLTLTIGITNRSLPLMKWLIQKFGGVYYHRSSENPNWADRYDWSPKGKKNKEEFLLGILPYLIIKREQANVALQFLRLDGEINPTKRQELCNQLCELNRRGKSPTTNTSNIGSNAVKIESELMGDHESLSTVM
jgi:hypothetical protein